jgi:HEAT repeat protein/predicted Zn-dependent protease
VGRRLVLATVWFSGAVVVAASPQSARAEWQVHRGSPSGLLERGEQALHENPDDETLARRVVRLAGHGGAGALRARFHTSAAETPTYASVASYAQILLALGDAGEAAAVFAEASKLAPDAVGALSGRARALTAMGDLDGGVAAYDEALLQERRPVGRRHLIDAELALFAPGAGRGDLARRIELRRELVRLTPNSDAESERLADLLETAGRPAEAAEALERRLPPGRAATKLALALRAARLRQADGEPADGARAAAGLEALIRQLPAGASERRREVWTCARDVARSRGALGALAEDLARAPGPVEWEILGQVRDELGDLEGALAATRTALDRQPRDAAIGRRLIALLERLGRDEDATVVLAELARRIPTEVDFSTELASRQVRNGARAAAGATLDRAIVRFARQPEALRVLAESAARAGDDRRALAVWERLHRLDPSSELAIVGLGEAQFQSGEKDDARRTWSALRKRAGSAAAGHLRVGEVLFDHDLFAEAVDEARAAQLLDGKSVGPHRLLAQIYERQRKPDAALEEWNRVLAIASPADSSGRPGRSEEREERLEGSDAGLRREARTHLLGLLGRQGRARLEAEVSRLRDEADSHPDDPERALYLTEAQQRLGDSAGAISTLRAILARATATAGIRNPTDPHLANAASASAQAAAVEAGFALAHLLERTGRLDEAVARLDDLSRLGPERARDAQLQIAGIALERYDVTAALDRAAAAEPGADPSALARIAEIRERAGADELAISTYQKASQGNAPAATTLSAARISIRQGDDGVAATAIETFLRTSRDDASVTEAARQALTLDEFLDRLPQLAESLSITLPDGQETAARRKALVAVLKRILPALYRDPGADAARARLGQRALRPLLELVTDANRPPDVSAIELLGLLGNTDAAPALARIAAPGSGPELHPRSNATNGAAEAQLAAIVALGRLGDRRGRSALERAAAAGGTAPRTAAIWSLGRISDSSVTPLLQRAVEDPRPEIQAAACLGLGRHADEQTTTLLAQLAADPTRSSTVRLAAIAGLGRSGRPIATPTLVDLLDAGDPDLARAAAFALARGRDPRALPALLTRALLPERFALVDADAPLAALGIWLADDLPPDEARYVTGDEIELADALAAFTEAPAPGDLAPLWRGQTRTLEDLLAEALSHGGARRRAALAALDSRSDGPGLGALAPEQGDRTSPDVALALREIALPLADRLASLLDDPEAAVRAAALRVLSKLDDERATPARLTEAVRDGSAALADAAADVARRLAQHRPFLGPALAAGVAPILGDDESPGGWRRRYAAVEVLAALGPAGRLYLERAVADPHPVVSGAARAALRQPAGRAR